VSEEWTTLKVLDWTTGRFERADIDSPRLEAQVLLSHALKCDRVALYMSFDKPLRSEELAAYRGLIERRLAGEPVAYLVGEQEFWSLPFTVDRTVLVPRRDTETLIEVVLDEVGERARALRIADIATGSGAIAITLASELTNAIVIATDISDAAVAMATKNAARNDLAARVDVRQGDLLEPVAGEEPFDIIAANLPYVRSADIDGLSSEVKHEPRGALDGGADGLDIVRRLIDAAPAALVPGGLLVLEHGFDQADDVTALFAASGAFEPAQTRKDLGDQPRITWARKNPAPMS
jgi:release factor glutamine methyltransferase